MAIGITKAIAEGLGVLKRVLQGMALTTPEKRKKKRFLAERRAEKWLREAKRRKQQRDLLD